MDTTTNIIISNMYTNGSIQRDSGNGKANASTYITPDKDFKIVFYRESFPFQWTQPPGSRYKCHLIFYNNLDIELLHLILTEHQVFYLLYNLSECYLGSYNTTIGTGYYSANNIDCEYSIIVDFLRLHPQDNNQDYYHSIIDGEIFFLLIQEFSYSKQCMYNKLKIKLDWDSWIDFNDLLFFKFLIDIIDLPEYKEYYELIYDYV